jgi:cell wall-associated NlpC family hydrolase
MVVIPALKKGLLVSLVTVLVACGSAPPVVAPSPTEPVAAAPEVPATLSHEGAQGVTVYALGLVGTPYRFGGNTPDTGFDCSGLISHVYRQQAGISSPRTVAALKRWGQPVPNAQLRTGDLVVFFQGTEANHAGIYVGEGRFVHAPSTGGRVRMDHLSSPYWAKQTMAYRRP